MHYKIIEKFGPNDGEKWKGYINWRGLTLESFDSVDSILRPDLFVPKSDSDWENCVNEDFKINLITNLPYAVSIIPNYQNAVLVGVETDLDERYIIKESFLGFDIIDEQCSISLLTNWGTDDENIMNPHIERNGLVKDLKNAIDIKNILRNSFHDDAHAEFCEVWAIYKISLNQSFHRTTLSSR
jgi:hypothetical protein